MRVVSLVPSVTETLLAWDIEPIAVTRFCEQPSLRAVGGTKDPDVGAIVALGPDLVVVNDEENRREDADALSAAGVPLHVTHVHTVADVEPTLTALAGALGLGADAAKLWTRDSPGVPAGSLGADPVRRAFVPIWRRPWMTFNDDTYGASMLRAIGIANVFGDEAERYVTTSLEEAASRRPDVVFAPTEPYPFADRHLPELRRVAADARLVDGQDLFWWGSRTPAALVRLAQVLAE